MAYLQLDVPQQGEQLADFLRLVVRQFFTTEDQQIDCLLYTSDVYKRQEQHGEKPDRADGEIWPGETR